MDYYDDNPIKVNTFMPHIKKMRKEQRKARKALKTRRKAEKLAMEEGQINENQNDSNDSYEYRDYYELERMKKVIKISLQETFDWAELEEDLRKENVGSDDDLGSDYENEDENYPDEHDE